MGPRLNGAYVNSENTKAIVFTCCGENDETEKRIIIVEDSSKDQDTSATKVDAFSQAKVKTALILRSSVFPQDPVKFYCLRLIDLFPVPCFIQLYSVTLSF